MKIKHAIRDEKFFEVLRFLWDWKLATTSGLHQHLYANISSEAAYYRLARIEKGGFIQTQVDPSGRNHVWSLTKRGFETVRTGLPALREEGCRSEHPVHDLLVSALHLGEWWFDMPEGVELCTEQHLRRYEPKKYPDWVPKNTLHLPDGYWHLTLPHAMTIALEVELTPKSFSRYEKAARFYDGEAQINRVIWIVPTTSAAQKIENAIHGATDGNTKHNFVLLGDAMKNEWQAQFFHGPDRTKTISSLLTECPQKSHRTFCMHYAVDTRKCPYAKPLSEISILKNFADWVRRSPNRTLTRRKSNVRN